MNKKIAYITWGCGSQILSFRDYAHWMDDMIYLNDLPSTDLTQYAAVIISCHTNGSQLEKHARQINAYVESGGFLIAFPVKNIDQWLTAVDVTWENKRISDWLWWTKPDGHIELYLPNPEHNLFDFVSFDDMKWHWHGVFNTNHSGTSLLNMEEDQGSVMVDFPDLPNGGRVLLTTLDPHSHNGQRFMPAAKRLIDGFYPWLNRELGIDREQVPEFTVTYLSSSDIETENEPPYLQDTFANTPGRIRFQSVYEIDERVWNSDVIVVPRICDQIYLRTRQAEFMNYLKQGGQLVINSETVIEWLPVLKPFRTVPPRPFQNLKVRVANDPYGFFSKMPEGFDGWEGVFGQYSRSYSDMPEDGIALTHVGTESDPKPSDWLWQYPTDDGRGGKIVVHNGDDYHRYPDHGTNKNGLLRDICVGLVRHRKHAIVNV
ncbi:hypothetical protein [Vibrio nigripulchritudo]|uniref:hypothetical protein n=1 Tax=Vibrio nigripulchritudo TaxID=28173 RepID=UPI002493A55F|nr:hypothetical protein [Vibrio nigripulchritudo]BDU37835.1 hypothetical protein TUMSATVNIG2_23040 [Vibrio nigripulchritudo]BDU43555.1 hypothetical protein TUMSATVNIG3_23530 [Vibrio nigripulchritudo]